MHACKCLTSGLSALVEAVAVVRQHLSLVQPSSWLPAEGRGGQTMLTAEVFERL